MAGKNGTEIADATAGLHRDCQIVRLIVGNLVERGEVERDVGRLRDISEPHQGSTTPGDHDLVAFIRLAQNISHVAEALGLRPSWNRDSIHCWEFSQRTKRRGRLRSRSIALRQSRSPNARRAPAA